MKTTALTGLSPSDCVGKLNNALCSQIVPGVPVSLFYAVIDLSDGTLEYVNAGQNAPYILPANGNVRLLSSEVGSVIGMDSETVFPQRTVTLEPGESIFLYTDGLIRAFDIRRHQFSVQRLEETLEHGNALPAQELTEKVIATVAKFVGDAAPTEDLTCLTLRRTN